MAAYFVNISSLTAMLTYYVGRPGHHVHLKGWISGMTLVYFYNIYAIYMHVYYFGCYCVIDQFVAEEKKLMDFIPKLVKILKDDSQCVYVHCWGGHGRTGIIIAILLAILYKIDADKALELTEDFHAQRVECRSHSPQTAVQFEQVRDAVKKLSLL